VAFYKCEICGNLVELIKRGGGQLVCCSKPMTELKANTTGMSAVFCDTKNVGVYAYCNLHGLWKAGVK